MTTPVAFRHIHVIGETMNYIERERERAEAAQQEQLDWLHQQHEEMLVEGSHEYA